MALHYIVHTSIDVFEEKVLPPPLQPPPARVHYDRICPPPTYVTNYVLQFETSRGSQQQAADLFLGLLCGGACACICVTQLTRLLAQVPHGGLQAVWVRRRAKLQHMPAADGAAGT